MLLHTELCTLSLYEAAAGAYLLTLLNQYLKGEREKIAIGNLVRSISKIFMIKEI